MKEKRLFAMLATIAILLIAFVMLFAVVNRLSASQANSPFRPYQCTYAGAVVWCQLHPDGSYSFFSRNSYGGLGGHIATVSSDDAVKMH